MNPVSSPTQLPRVCAIAALFVLLTLTLVLSRRKTPADTIHTIGNNGPVQVLSLNRSF